MMTWNPTSILLAVVCAAPSSSPPTAAKKDAEARCDALAAIMASDAMRQLGRQCEFSDVRVVALDYSNEGKDFLPSAGPPCKKREFRVVQKTTTEKGDGVVLILKAGDGGFTFEALYTTLPQSTGAGPPGAAHGIGRIDCGSVVGTVAAQGAKRWSVIEGKALEW